MVDTLSDSLANQIDQRLTLQESETAASVSVPALVNRAATLSLDESLDFPTVCATGSINVGTPKGSVLYSSLVSPVNFSTQNYQSRLAYVARLFAQWNGTIRLSLVFTKVIFQQLKLIIAYHPGVFDLESFNSFDVDSLAALQYSKIFNPNNDVQVDFDIPFICPSIWCSMSGSIGCLSLRIFQPLVASSNDINSIFWTMRVCRSPISPSLSFRNVLPVPYLPSPGPGPSPGPTPGPTPPYPSGMSALDVALNVFVSPCFAGHLRVSAFSLEAFTSVVFIPPTRMRGARLLSRRPGFGSMFSNRSPGSMVCRVELLGDKDLPSINGWPKKAFARGEKAGEVEYFVPAIRGQTKVGDRVHMTSSGEAGDFKFHGRVVGLSEYFAMVKCTAKEQPIVGSDTTFTIVRKVDCALTELVGSDTVVALSSVPIVDLAFAAGKGLLCVEPFFDPDSGISLPLGWERVEVTLFVGKVPLAFGTLSMSTGVYSCTLLPGVNEMSNPDDIIVQPLGPNVYFRFGKFIPSGLVTLSSLKSYL